MTEAYEDILYEVSERIATITMNHPERMNALTPTMQAEIHSAFDRADKDPDVKVIILTGAGVAFCAGFHQGRRAAFGSAGQVACRVFEALVRHRQFTRRPVDPYVDARKTHHRGS